MKSLYLRAGLLACALGLSACGGGKGSLQLGGSIVGVTRDGLQLQNNGGSTLTVPANSTSFVFTDLVKPDSSYNVTVLTPPAAATCTVTGGKGTMGAFSVASVIVQCITFSYDIGGTITGLGPTNTGLVLANGSSQQAIAAGATTFTMTKYDTSTPPKPVSGQVPDSSPYGVTVLTQPVGKTCTVANGVGTMGSAAINTIQVNCI